MDIEIREYRDSDEQEWMRVHSIILSISHSWNYSIQERPPYTGNQSTRLVAVHEGKTVGLTKTAHRNTPGQKPYFCIFTKISPPNAQLLATVNRIPLDSRPLLAPTDRAPDSNP